MRALLLAMCLALGACTTGRYNDQPMAVVGQPDTYRFKVYVGGFSGDEQALNRLLPDLDAFQRDRGYKGHTVVSRYYAPFPLSHYDYTIRFDR